MRWGTSYFVGREAAERYYGQFYGDPATAVTRKIAEGEIHIGKPPLKPGERLTVIPGEGRYMIEAPETEPVGETER